MRARSLPLQMTRRDSSPVLLSPQRRRAPCTSLLYSRLFDHLPRSPDVGYARERGPGIAEWVHAHGQSRDADASAMQEEEEDKDDTEGWRSVGPALARESDSSSPLCTRTRLSPGRSFKFQAQEDGEGEGRRNVTDEYERGREGGRERHPRSHTMIVVARVIVDVNIVS